MNDPQSDAWLDRCIGLGAIGVGVSVLFFALKLRPDSNLFLVRKMFGIGVAVILIGYGLYSLVAG